MENHSFYLNVFFPFPYYKICTFETHEQGMFSKAFPLAMKTSDLLTHYQTPNFRLVQIETNCRRHFKGHLKWKIGAI